MFELIASFPVDPVFIARRLVMLTHPYLTFHAIFCTAVWSLLMTLSEVAATIYLVWAGWHRLGTELRVVIPIAFSIWVASQLHLMRILAMLAAKQKRYMSEQEPVCTDGGDGHDLSEDKLVRQNDGGGVVGGNEGEDGESKMNSSKVGAAKQEQTERRARKNRRGILRTLMRRKSLKHGMV